MGILVQDILLGLFPFPPVLLSSCPPSFPPFLSLSSLQMHLLDKKETQIRVMAVLWRDV